MAPEEQDSDLQQSELGSGQDVEGWGVARGEIARETVGEGTITGDLQRGTWARREVGRSLSWFGETFLLNF